MHGSESETGPRSLRRITPPGSCRAFRAGAFGCEGPAAELRLHPLPLRASTPQSRIERTFLFLSLETLDGAGCLFRPSRPRTPAQAVHLSERIEELVARLEWDPVSRMGLHEVADLGRDMGFIRRRQGMGALAPLVDKMDDQVLAAGMRAEIHRRHWMVTAGLLGIQEGRDPEDIVAEPRAVASERVERLLATGIHGQVNTASARHRMRLGRAIRLPRVSRCQACGEMDVTEATDPACQPLRVR